MADQISWWQSWSAKKLSSAIHAKSRATLNATEGHYSPPLSKQNSLWQRQNETWTDLFNNNILVIVAPRSSLKVTGSWINITKTRQPAQKWKQSWTFRFFGHNVSESNSHVLKGVFFLVFTNFVFLVWGRELSCFFSFFGRTKASFLLFMTLGD